MASINDVGVDCCIGGGGPAGVVLGLLLARKGVRMVLEPPTRFIQRVQAMLQKQLIRCALEDKEFTLPGVLRSMLAKTIGMGPRPEFVED